MPYSADPPRWWPDVQSSIVSLAVELRTVNGDKQWMLASGFTIEYAGRWFWITADHVFHSQRYQDCEGYDTFPRYFPFVEARFAPLTESVGKGVLVRFGSDNVFGLPDLALHLAKAGVDAERTNFLSGLDIAVVELIPYYRENLKACGVIPLTSSDIVREYDPEFMEAVRVAKQHGNFGIYVVGIPKSSFSEDVSGALSMAQKRLPVREVEHESFEHKFVPAWTARSHEGSVQGMSGGPIFAIVGNRAYLYAVQSSEKYFAGVVQHLKAASAPYMCRVLEAVAQAAPTCY